MKTHLLILASVSAIAQFQTPITVRQNQGTATGEIRLEERRSNGTNYTSVKAPQSLAADISYTLPSAYPTTTGQFLTSTTGGVWSWATPATGAVDYDIRTYGAVCDGSTDDTAAFNAAITAVGSSRGMLVVPGGVCIVTTVQWTSSIQGVRGHGIYSSVVKSTTNAPVFSVPTAATSGEFYYLEFRDLTIEGDGSSTSQVGISATGTGRLNVSSIHNVRFQNIRKGLYVSTSINSDYIKFTDNVCQTTYYCVEKAVGGSGWIIDANQISSATGGTGIYIHGSAAVGDIVINNNHIEGGAVGIALYCDTTCTYGQRNIVNGNKIDGTTTAPITAFNVQNSTFLGNRVQGSAEVVTFTGTDAGNIGDFNGNSGISVAGQGRFGGTAAGFYEALNVQNTTTGAYGACLSLSATDSVTSNVYVAGRMCGRYTSNNFSSEEIKIQTQNGSGFDDAITIVNDDVTIDDTLAVGGNATLNGSINTMSGTLRPGFTGLGSIGDSSFSYGAGYFDAVVTPLIGTNTTTNVVIERNNVAAITIISGEVQFAGDINIGGEVNSDLLPQTASVYDIGTPSNRWLSGNFVNLNLSGSVTGDIIPATNNTYALGSTSFYYSMVRSNAFRVHGANIAPDSSGSASSGAVTLPWSSTYTNSLIVNTGTTAPSGNTGASSTLTCGAGQAVKNITVSGGFVTSVSCGTP